MTEKIILYGHNSCPGMPGVLALLHQSKVNYDYINIMQDEAARQRVREINGGYESVPTLVFPDGSSLTEPSTQALKGKLQAYGYHVPLHALLLGNFHWLITGAVVLYGILSFLELI